MDRAVNEMSEACDEFINAATDFIHSCAAASGGLSTPEIEAAKKGFSDNWESVKDACDRAEDLVQAARRDLVGDLASVAGDDVDYEFVYEDDDDDDVKDFETAEPCNAVDYMLSVTPSPSPSPSPSQTSVSRESEGDE